MFLIMTCDGPRDDDRIPLVEVDHFFSLGGHSWFTGRPMTEPIDEPIDIPFRRRDSYQGPPPELSDTGVPLMSLSLATALLQYGVDNMDLYRARLHEDASGAAFEYMAYNMIGLVAAADLDNSEWSSFDAHKPVVDVSFSKLVIDPSSAHGILMFRLAEDVKALMVDEGLAEHLTKSGFNTLTFLDPDDWFSI